MMLTPAHSILDDMISRHEFLWINIANDLSPAFLILLDQVLSEKMGSSLRRLVDFNEITGVINKTAYNLPNSELFKTNPNLLITTEDVLDYPLYIKTGFSKIIILNNGMARVPFYKEPFKKDEKVYLDQFFNPITHRKTGPTFKFDGIVGEIQIFGYKKEEPS